MSLSARRIEQIAARLCTVQARGNTPYCSAHRNVVAEGALVCGHVRPVLDQIVAVVVETHVAPDVAAGDRSGPSVVLDVSA